MTDDLVGMIDWEARTLELVVRISDGEGSAVRLELFGDIPNLGPVADAGPDQILECDGPGGARPVLSAAASSDVEGLDDLVSLSWSASTGDDHRFVGSGRRMRGRTYTIVLEAEDSHGNVTRREVEVSVPHDQRPSMRCETGDLAPVVPHDDLRCEADLPTSTRAAVPPPAAAPARPDAPGMSRAISVSHRRKRTALLTMALLLLGLRWWRRR